MAAPALYARYVPPKPASNPARSHVSTNNVVTSSPASETAAPPDQKRKREEHAEPKRKKARQDHDTADESLIVIGGTRHATEELREAPVIEKKQPKRPKIRKVEATPVTDHVEDDEDTTKRHAGVFSKFQKSLKASADLPAESPEVVQQDDEEMSPRVLHDLVPIPMPKEPELQEAFSAQAALPPWLANPLRISKDAAAPFASLLDEKLAAQLDGKGFKQALPVQAGVLPLLLPSVKQHPGDVCVSAATGSGKTLAYVLPIVESLKSRTVRMMKAVIVVPTRELVSQVEETAKMCAAGTDLRIGIAVGHHAFRNEQEALVLKSQRYEPELYHKLQQEAQRRAADEEIDSDDDDDLYSLLPYHIHEYTSKVDILICTPGRLIEHINTTKGFSMKDLQWFVIDEADRLLDQSFQEWVEVLQNAMAPSPYKSQDKFQPAWLAPELGLRPYGWVRKVILSATMTRDLEKLGSLRLRNPCLVVVEGTQVVDSEDTPMKTTSGNFTVPSTLQEHGISVGDGSDKPLYLLKLLQQLLDDEGAVSSSKKQSEARTTKPSASSVTSSSASESEDDSDDSSDSSDTSDDSESSDASSSEDDAETSENDSDSDSESSASSASSVSQNNKVTADNNDEPAKAKASRNALIFVKSNESAARLTHLLQHLHPRHASKTASITKSGTNAGTRKLLSRFQSGSLRILIATDRASRGLDLSTLANVINYDVPHDVVSYIHRVGRTARAGMIGTAWTLVEDREAAWFWNAVARGKGSGGSENNDKIERDHGRKVERTKLDLESLGPEPRQRYVAALAKLGAEVRATAS